MCSLTLLVHGLDIHNCYHYEEIVLVLTCVYISKRPYINKLTTQATLRKYTYVYLHFVLFSVTYEIFKEDPSSPHSYDRYTGPAGGLAYDWLAKNLYYTDITYKWVWLFTTRGPRQPKMIIPKTSDRVPFAIAVSPLKR